MNYITIIIINYRGFSSLAFAQLGPVYQMVYRECRESRGHTDPPSSRALRASHEPKILFPFPLERLSRRLDYLSNSGEKWNVCTRNIEILVKPSHYLSSIFVIFLSCQCGLL